MRKRSVLMVWAALAGLSACLENPGVDERLATRHDRVAAFAYLESGDLLAVRLERMDGTTRAYLGNPTGAEFDSVAFFLQGMGYPHDPWFVGPGGVSMAFSRFPLFEIRGVVAGLTGESEVFLGEIPAELPSLLDGIHLVFIPIGAWKFGAWQGEKFAGYYEGSFSERNSAEKENQGTMRGVVAAYAFYFDMESRGKDYGTLCGGFYRNRFFDANYDGLWFFNGFIPLADTVARDSISAGFSLYANGGTSHADSIRMDVRLKRHPGTRWAPGNASLPYAGPRPPYNLPKPVTPPTDGDFPPLPP